MSTSYYIYRFAKPKQSEVGKIEWFSSYDVFNLKDADGDDTGEQICLYRWDDKYATNIRDSRFSLELTLPEKETDYGQLYKFLGFSEDDIRNDRVHLAYGRYGRYEYCAGNQKAIATYDDIDKFAITIQTHCFAVKTKLLWDSSDTFCHPNHERVLKYLPDIDDFRYVPVSNQILAKAEIPFLIFEKNKGRCFMEKD